MRQAILNFYKNVNLDIGDIGSAISHLDDQHQYAISIEKKGGHVDMVNGHILKFLREAGYRASNLAYVLWEIEKTRRESSIKTDINDKDKTFSSKNADRHVILDCTFTSTDDSFYGIRVWETMYLCDKDSEHKSKLIYAENIALYPFKTEIPRESLKQLGIEVPYPDTVKFKLYFEGLPTNCKSFYLVENRSEECGFEISNITRNEKDEYDVEWRYNEKSIEKIYYQQELKKYL